MVTDEDDVPRTFYGDPVQGPWDTDSSDKSAPRDGDELCDGHVMHYRWDEEKECWV